MLLSECKNSLCSFGDLVPDADMAGFRDGFSMYSNSEFQDLPFGVSPAHSLDSGVDNIEEYLFDFENKHCYSNDLWKDGHSNDDIMVDVTDDLSWLEHCKRDEPEHNFKTRKRTKLEESIEEDHCYTTRMFGNDSLSSNAIIDVIQAGIQDDRDNHGLSRTTTHIPRQSTEEENKERLMKRGNEEVLEEMALRNTADKCSNRNAVMARLNRERKKRYVNNLESEVSTLRKQNTTLSEENQNLKINISKCKEELAYLRNVLENQSMLSSVIQAVSGIAGVNMKGIVNTSGGKSRVEDKRSACFDVDTHANGGITQKLQDKDNSNEENIPFSFNSNQSGVCLHVQQENVSIEFCHHCSVHATSLN